MKRLNAMGLGRQDRVAIVLANGPEMAVAFLAVTAGATCAPLNPSYRAHEFDFYLSDLKAKALIVESGIDSPARGVARARGIPVIDLSPLTDAEAGTFTLDGEAHSPPVHHGFSRPEDVALVLHTSGTTSRPKIVPLTQHNICTSAINIGVSLGLNCGDRCLNVMPLFHIHGLIGATLSSLLAGASVVCTPGFYAPEFFGWMAEFRPTWYTAVPTMHQSILSRAESNQEIIRSCKLRFIRSCSSALPPQVMVQLESVFDVPVIEAYGMTEASHQMTSNPLPPRQRKAGSVGVPTGLDVAVMDEGGCLLPPGATGEVVVRGASVTGGYDNNPQANESAFTDGWFRTGDQGFLDADRYLFLTGRLKEMINRAGEKISPREIDEVLIGHPAVAQAVTFALPDPKLGEEVAAAVVLRDESPATARDLREFAAARLADFKVPRKLLILDEIPKGPTGKLQRIGLAEKLGLSNPDQQQPNPDPDFTSPRTPAEEKIAKIWAEILGLSRVSIYDDFFRSGGDSIMATRLLSRVSEDMGIELSLSSFFETPTVVSLAESLENHRAAG